MEKKFRITVNGRKYDVTVEDISEGSNLLIPEPGSMQIPQPVPPVAAPQPAAPAAGPGDEVSPLAGVVQTMDVTMGQEVKEGVRVATLEAMKMCTVIYAHRSGPITNIAVKPGDAVDAGQTLLTIG